MSLNNIIKSKTFILIGWIAFFELISAAIGLSTRFGMYPWYSNLNKSSFTPPGYVFSIVWPLLYCSLAILGYLLYRKRKNSVIDKLFKLYWVQMILNWLWSPIFFNLHLTGIALFILMLIVTITIYIILKLIKLNSNYGYIILPYLLWVCFATYLNIVIVATN
jgi:tryptophan-rich sensory protein